MDSKSEIAIKSHSIVKYAKGALVETVDQVVAEAPLGIQIRFFAKQKWQKKDLTVTMRTPGNDKALVLGFLFTEGIIGNVKQIDALHWMDDNNLVVQIVKELPIDQTLSERSFYASASCGVCGKASMEQLEKNSCYFPLQGLPKIAPSTILPLPDKLRNIQSVFDQTGGIHAAGLFSAEGELLTFAEDVGRHNALDKLIGQCLNQGQVPLRQQILVLSGRVGFELVQKAKMVGLPIIAAVGAPSSLAIALAEEAGMTLIGFLRAGRFNIYCGGKRVEHFSSKSVN